MDELAPEQIDNLGYFYISASPIIHSLYGRGMFLLNFIGQVGGEAL